MRFLETKLPVERGTGYNLPLRLSVVPNSLRNKARPPVSIWCSSPLTPVVARILCSSCCEHIVIPVGTARLLAVERRVYLRCRLLRECMYVATLHVDCRQPTTGKKHPLSSRNTHHSPPAPYDLQRRPYTVYSSILSIPKNTMYSVNKSARKTQKNPRPRWLLHTHLCSLVSNDHNQPSFVCADSRSREQPSPLHRVANLQSTASEKVCPRARIEKLVELLWSMMRLVLIHLPSIGDNPWLHSTTHAVQLL